MRARWLKPEFFRDKKMGEAGPVVALVYEALWCVADDGGTAPCTPAQLKGDMFTWWSAVGVPEITGALRHLSGIGRIECFQVGDEWFCRIKHWDKHQSIHKPSVFRYPATGQRVSWDGEALVREECGTSVVTPASYTPRLLSSSSAAEESFFTSLPEEQHGRWSALLDAWRQGMGYVGGKAADQRDIDAGLLEYLAHSPDLTFAPVHVQSFIENARRRRVAPETAKTTAGPVNMANALAIAADIEAKRQRSA